MEAVHIRLSGIPRGKGRPRFRKGGGRPFTPKETRENEIDLAWMARRAMEGREPFECAVVLEVTATLPVPKSWSRTDRNLASQGMIFHTAKPDCDNLLKSIDALNKIVWIDDSQVVDARVRKVYGNMPRLDITVREA